jgi:4-amino-4-deoxy-L-arabinose transferase-like glycosyltransferase
MREGSIAARFHRDPETRYPEAGFSRRLETGLVLTGLLFYLALRLVAWHNTVLMDDTDSLFYLKNIDTYYSLDWSAINRLNTDSTPFYPAMGALAKSVVGDSETAARLVSFIFSIILVIAVWRLARNLDGQVSGVLAIFLLSLSAPMISLSCSILTEPSFIATLYVGLLLFWRRIDRPQIACAMGIGLVFGLAFLNRTEGILYLVVVPFCLALLSPFAPPVQSGPRFVRFFQWSTVYALAFLMLALPQIVHVSIKAGSPTLNGRIAWQKLVSAMPDRSTNAAIFGLDFSDEEINISYIHRHYKEALQRLKRTNDPHSRTEISNRFHKSLHNIDHIYRLLVGLMITPLGFALAFIGLMTLYLRKYFSALLFCIVFLAAMLIGPVEHTNLVPRHLSVVIPMVCLLQAIGLRATVLNFSRMSQNQETKKGILAVLILGLLTAGQMIPIWSALRPPQRNMEYDPAFLANPVRLIKAMQPVPSIAARRQYIAYFSGADFFWAPFSEYDKLVRYLEKNHVKLFYIEYDQFRGYPYIDVFKGDGFKQHFEKIWENEQDGTPRAALFSLKSSTVSKGPLNRTTSNGNIYEQRKTNPKLS